MIHFRNLIPMREPFLIRHIARPRFGTFVISFLALLLLVSLPAHAQRPLGIDVYSGSGTITWSTVKSNGIAFAWAKATEGTYYHDADFTANEVNGKAAGVYMGAYDFARPDLYSPATEASYFWNEAGPYIKNDGKSLMPMLDFETFNGYTNASSYADWVNQWCHDIQTNATAHGTTVTPVIYISSCNACYLNSTVSGWGAWLANYNGESSNTGNPWNTCTSCEVWGSGVWNFWQFTSSAIIPGVPGNSSGYCDEDVFNGTLAGLVSAFVVGGISIASQPTNVTVAAGGTAKFNVTASGSGTLGYQWFFNQKTITNAIASTYVITNAQLANAGGYTVLITNNLGNVLSAPAFLSVLGPQTNAPNSALAPANLLNWWTADGNGVDIYSRNNAVPNNGLYYTNGEVGLSFHFDGSTSYLTPATNTTISPNWTFCAWVNRQNAPGVSAALVGDSTYAVKLEQYNGTRQIGITHSGVADWVFHCSLPQNAWTHLALVNNGSQILLYSNGVFVTSQLYSNNVAVPAPSGFPLPRGCIGGDLLANGSLADPMLGRLDEIQTFNRALSAAEISAIYNAGSAGLVRAPEFTGVVATNSSQIQLQFRGLTGKNFTLFGSPDLTTWTALGIIPNPTGATNYTGSTSVNSQYFYRASQP